ncbi:AMP-binding protein [Lysinibacillus pakistanensis]|uniref:AMP-binding protein n=1 Tax=Lysinibacillus pakistanensis TaxID=759811 RepID=UPI003D2A41D8
MIGGTTRCFNWILQRANLTPLRNALTYKEQTWTFQQLNELSIQRARQLTALGIKQGDRIAIMGQASRNLLL